MNNNKQSYISKIRRQNRLLSYKNSEQQLKKLKNKSINSPFELQQIQYFHDRITQIPVQAYMEASPCF